MVVKTLHGLETVLAQELKELGAAEVHEGKRAVSFVGDKAMMYQANMCLRTALRILKPIDKFDAIGPDALYNQLKQIDWSQYLSITSTFAIDATINNSTYFTHSHYVALRSKDAIADQFMEKESKRPSVDTIEPDVRVNVHIADSTCTISLDSSSESLHKRGYRTRAGDAPINEVLAAGILLLSEWDGKQDLVDPMCGSGTFLIEAALLAMNRPPNLAREQFGFMHWKDYDESLYQQLKEDAAKAQQNDCPVIKGYDVAFGALSTARTNIEKAGLTEFITLDRADFFRKPPQTEGMYLIFNPPYGERMKLSEEDFYKKLGDVFKQQYTGSTVWMITSDLENTRFIGLRPSRRIGLFNGKLECKLLKYELYEGTKRSIKNQWKIFSYSSHGFQAT